MTNPTSKTVGTPAPGNCPFCGSPDTAQGWEYQTRVYIFCRRCGARGPWVMGDDVGAISSWNMRSPVETSDATRMRNTLVQAGYTDCGGELWKPPLGPRPAFLDENLRLRDFLKRWTYEGRLQSFEDRERFRKEAAELITPEEPSSSQAPIARIRVANDKIVDAKMLAPGLSTGVHDLYCEPEAMREHLHWCAIHIGKSCNCRDVRKVEEAIAREGLKGAQAGSSRRCLAMINEFGDKICSLPESHGGPHAWVTPDSAPPVDNDHVADGCEKFDA